MHLMPYTKPRKGFVLFFQWACKASEQHLDLCLNQQKLAKTIYHLQIIWYNLSARRHLAWPEKR